MSNPCWGPRHMSEQIDVGTKINKTHYHLDIFEDNQLCNVGSAWVCVANNELLNECINVVTSTINDADKTCIENCQVTLLNPVQWYV